MTTDFRVQSVIPPMTQLYTPYPSTAYLTGFLRSRGIHAVQVDLALALVLKLFTPAGLEAVRGQALALPEAQRTGSVLLSWTSSTPTAAPSALRLPICKGATRRWLPDRRRAACCPRGRAFPRRRTAQTPEQQPTQLRPAGRCAGGAAEGGLAVNIVEC